MLVQYSAPMVQSPNQFNGGNYVQQFTFPSFSAANDGVGATQISTPDSAAVSAPVVNITPSVSSHTVGAVWYNTQQDITQSFSTTFKFCPVPGGLAANARGGCMAFVVQNSNSTTNGFYNASASFVDVSGLRAGSDANMGGFGAFSPSIGPNQQAIGNSIAIKFDTFCGNVGSVSFPSGSNGNSTGLFINGGNFAALMPELDLNPYGINFSNGNDFQATIVYDNTLKLLTMVIQDLTTLAQARMTWPIDIINVINSVASSGATSAWVGFSAGNPPNYGTPQQLKSWTYGTGMNARLPTPTISYSSPTVTITGPGGGASVYYTTDGTAPTSSSPLYTGPFTISANQPVQAVAIQSGYTDSLVAAQNCLLGTTLPINYSSFAAGDGILVSGNGAINGSNQIILARSGQVGVAAAYHALPVPVSGSWTSTFNFNMTSIVGNGLLFHLHNQGKLASNYTTPYVPITGISSTGTSVTVSFATQASAPPIGQTFTIYGVAPFAYNTYAISQTISSAAASGTGTTATITFSDQGYIPQVGASVVVSGITPTGYNGTYTITASTSTSVSYANTTTGAQTVGGSLRMPNFSSTTSSITYPNNTTATPTVLGSLCWDGIGGGSYVGGGPTAYANPSGNGRGWGNASLNFGAGTGQFGGFANSIGWYLDISTNTLSQATNGQPLPNSGVSVSPVNLSSTTPITASVAYNSSTNQITVSLTQGANNKTVTYSSVNVPSIVGANTAYAGFIGTTGGSTVNLYLNNWTMG